MDMSQLFEKMAKQIAIIFGIRFNIENIYVPMFQFLPKNAGVHTPVVFSCEKVLPSGSRKRKLRSAAHTFAACSHFDKFNRAIRDLLLPIKIP